MREIRQLSSNRTTGLRAAGWVIVFPIIACLTLILISCNQSSGTWEQIQESGTLRIGVDPTFPPFALADSENVEGIDIELGRALASELKLEPRFTYFGYDGLYDALTTGQVDVLISALVIMPERAEDIAYTNPYFDAGLVLIIPNSAAGITSMDDLNGRVVSVEIGALGHVKALEWQRRLERLTVQTHTDVHEALDSVAKGKADAALVDSIGGRLYLRSIAPNEKKLTILPTPANSEPYVMAVRIGERELLSRLNTALDDIIRDGTLDDIIAAHLGP